MKYPIITSLLILLAGVLSISRADDSTGQPQVVIDFAQAVIGKPVPAWTEKGVVFTLAGDPQLSDAIGRVMFFPHLATTRKGILNAMANESIPVQAHLPGGGASSVTLVLWGSIGSAALLEAFDKSGKLVDKASLAVVPSRTSPADPIPSFELTVKAPQISTIRFSGSRPGGCLVADEVRFTPLAGAATVPAK